MNAVFLSGGGARGAYEVGVLRALMKDGPPIKLIGGASVGAINAVLAATGQTAWFDEMLWNEKYGTCRGTGVLVLVDGSWRISQYNLSIPMPNDLAAEFTSRIMQFEGEEKR